MLGFLIALLAAHQTPQDLLKPLSTWTTFGGEWKDESVGLVQTMPGYDIGAVTSVKTPDKPYRITLTFETRGDYVGAGLLFNCRNRDKTAYSMMVRADNDTLLCGYFDGAGTFVPMATPGLATKPGKHTLSVVVDNARMRYNAMFDGQRLVTNGALQYSSGYVGITSSGGAHAFTGLTMREATKDEMAGMKLSKMPQPISVAVGEYNAYVLTRGEEPIQVYNRDRLLVRKIGKDLDDPRKIDVWPGRGSDGQDALLVETARFLVALDTFSGKIIAKYPRPAHSIAGVLVPSIMNPGPRTSYAWVNDNKTISLQELEKDWFGHPGDGPIKDFPAPRLNNPTAICCDSLKLFVADSDMSKAKFDTHIFSTLDGEVKYVRTFSSWLDPHSIAALPDGNLAYVGGLGFYESGGCVRILDQEGGHVANASMFAFGTLSRRGAVAYGQNHIWVADPDNDCVYIYGMDLKEADPVVTHADGVTTIKWFGPMVDEDGAEIEVGTDMAHAKHYRAKRIGDSWEAHVAGLKPNTRYFYRFSPVCEMLPDEERDSREYSFVSPPVPGKRQAVETRIITATYLKTLADGKNHWTIPEAGAVDKVRREFEKGRLFYWRNSRCRFHTKLSDFVVIPDSEAIVNGGFLEPAQARRDLERMGKKPSDYDSIITVWAEPGFKAEGSDELGAVGGGGLTPYGYSTFGIGGRLAWLFVHEYNHQIDAFYDRAGSVKYWLNHPDATIHPGRYGQHFDCNAFINRNWRDDEYFTNSTFGHVILYDDKDGDGLPDDDPSLPMDEKRFGSEPTKRDTDGDGVDDLGEFMAGTFSSTNPRGPAPLYSCSNTVPMAKPIELRSPNAAYPPGSDPSPTVAGRLGTVRLNWAPDGLSVRVEPANPGPMIVEFDFDWNDDGWFTGNDNKSFRFTTDRSISTPTGTTRIIDASSTTLTIPASSLGKGPLAAGHKFGVRIRVEQNGVAVSPFDPWSLFEMELK